MLEKPSINKLTEVTGESRYTTALLVSKRARQIADKRVRLESDDISDCVEAATQEILNGVATKVEYVETESDLEAEVEEIIE